MKVNVYRLEKTWRVRSGQGTWTRPDPPRFGPDPTRRSCQFSGPNPTRLDPRVDPTREQLWDGISLETGWRPGLKSNAWTASSCVYPRLKPCLIGKKTDVIKYPDMRNDIKKSYTWWQCHAPCAAPCPSARPSPCPCARPFPCPSLSRDC